jgi:hypothetical protein
MLQVLREYQEDAQEVTEYTRDGETVSHTVRVPIQEETPPAEPTETEPTLEEKITRLEQQIQQDNLVTFEVLATIYEELLASKGSV